MNLIILICIVLLSSCSTHTYTYVKPFEINDDIKTGSLKSVFIDSTKIATMVTSIKNDTYPNIHSVLIIKNQKLVLEEYFNGFTNTTQHDLRSAGKSISSALIGIAIDKGYIKSENEPILPMFNYYPVFQYPSKFKSNIKIKHLLTMTSGLDCGDIYDYKNHSGYLMHLEKDPVKYYLDLKSIHKPGTKFNYNDSEPYMLSVIQYLNTGLQQDYFSDNFLFNHLKIETNNLGGTLKPRDMAKFGLLYLNKGKWNDKQIISEDWINKSTQNQVYWGFKEKSKKNPKNFSDGYGYYWWIKNYTIKGKKISSYMAAGNGGQYIIVFPSLDMVVVFTGGNYNNPKARQVLEVTEKYILNAI